MCWADFPYDLLFFSRQEGVKQIWEVVFLFCFFKGHKLRKKSINGKTQYRRVLEEGKGGFRWEGSLFTRQPLLKPAMCHFVQMPGCP